MDKKKLALIELMAGSGFVILALIFIFFYYSEILIYSRDLAQAILMIGFVSLFFGFFAGYGIKEAIEALRKS